jgi:SAM-dependent methyltransferase
MNNYEFCTQWILDKTTGNIVRVLDYGCGAGEIVQELRKRGVDAFGCDVFYDAGDRSKLVDPALFGSAIRKMEADKGYAIPFDDASFDFVVNNQVMEHVEDLDGVLVEIRRVLKPGGTVLSLFPHKGVWREGHCGVPFLHWFPKNTRARVYYAAACRIFGLGYHKENKSIMYWGQDKCEWLDKWTHYRTLDEIHSTFGKYFVELQHIEDYWLQQRLGGRKIVVSWLPAFTQKLVVSKLCGTVFTARKALA